MDPDSSVIKLNKDLASFEDHMMLSLHPRKCKYVKILYCLFENKIIIVDFKLCIPVLFWPGWCDFGDIELKFCICC